MTSVIPSPPAPRASLRRMEALSTDREPVFGHELITLVVEMGGTAGVEALRQAAVGRFGADAVYGNCHGDRFDFDGVLSFLAWKGKIALRGDSVSVGAVPACQGH